jgi:hypothetical protein
MVAKEKTYNIKPLIILLSLFMICSSAKSQTNYLYERITISFNDIPLEKALDQISKMGSFTFSYNSKNFDEKRLVSLNVENKTVSRSLNQLFNNEVKSKVVGSHVILTKKNPPTSKHSKTNEYKITGYIIDSQSGRKIQEATIYEINGNIVSLSNTEGFYSLTVPTEQNINGFSYSKQGYLDTVIIIEPLYNSELNIYLNPLESPELKRLESKYFKLEDIHNRQLVNILVPKKSKTISDNLIIHNKKLAQISFIPYIGTNRQLSGSVDNTLSLNVIAGYSGGVNGFELGGLLNIVKRNVDGSQIGGFANIVGGDTKYFQLAGFFNLNSGSVTGTQIGGFSNVVLDTLNGVQIAGFNNTLHGYMNGVQISGFSNITTQNADGIQLTCFVNIALKDVELGQISGFANYCDNVNGGQITGMVNIAKGDVNWGQISGFANYGKSVTGLQMSGFANISANKVSGGQLAGGLNYGKSAEKYQISGLVNIAKEEIDGAQLAGCINYAKKVNGYQIGFFNISDTIESGMPIGIISFVKKGFHRFEISTNEVFNLNGAYKSGVKKFYNTFRFGLNFTDKIYVGYGVGTQINFGEKFNLNLEYTSDIIFDKSFKILGEIDKLSLPIDYKINKHINIFGGPTFNLSLMKETTNNTFTSIAPYTFYTDTYSERQANVWIGGILGLSFTL